MFQSKIPQSNPDGHPRCRDSSLVAEGNERGRVDRDLANEVDDALWKEPTLRAMDYDHIEIRVRDGIVDLHGHVVSRTNGHLVEEAIRRVDGLAGIHNHLIADDQLLREVATALGLLEHTLGNTFYAGVSHGIVLLSGTANDATTRLRAERCAASNPNVRGVINSVRVQGGAMPLSNLPFSQPHIGTEFLFSDGVSGRVSQVIIEPDNRRVSAMTLQGSFADLRHEQSSANNDGSRLPERTLVVPMQSVRYLTSHSGFLNIHSAQSDRYTKFDPADFVIPPGDWKPPYPYCPADVLFTAKLAQLSTRVLGRNESRTAVALAHQVLKDEMLENDSLGG